jgi:hypothetical protein
MMITSSSDHSRAFLFREKQALKSKSLMGKTFSEKEQEEGGRRKRKSGPNGRTEKSARRAPGTPRNHRNNNKKYCETIPSL